MEVGLHLKQWNDELDCFSYSSGDAIGLGSVRSRCGFIGVWSTVFHDVEDPIGMSNSILCRLGIHLIHTYQGRSGCNGYSSSTRMSRTIQAWFLSYLVVPTLRSAFVHPLCLVSLSNPLVLYSTVPYLRVMFSLLRSDRLYCSTSTDISDTFCYSQSRASLV